MRQVRLKRLFDSVSGGSWGVEPEEGEVTLPCIRGTDFDYQVLRVDTRTAPVRGFSHHEAAKRAARRGDLIIEKSGGGEQQPAGRAVLHGSDDIAMPTNFAARLSPSADSDPRFLTYLLSALYTSGTTRSSIKQTTGIQNLDLHSFLDTVVLCPSLQDQRSIADFLDAETARIDALIAKKRRQQAALLEHEEAVLLDRLGDWRSTPHQTLRQYGALAVTGPFGTQLAASEYVHGETPVINPIHIERGRFKPDDEVTVPSQVAHRLRRHQLSMGDVVLGRKGDVGRSAIVTSKEVGWICGSDSIAVRTNRARLNPEFLVRLLSIDLYRQQLQATSTGTTMANVNQSTLLNLRLPALSLPEQDYRLSSAEHAIAAHEALTITLDNQLDLLAEHRQALITAAVTGRIEVPGVVASCGSGW